MFSWSTPPGMMPSSFHLATRLAGAIFSTNGDGLWWSRLNSARIASATRLGSVSRGSTAYLIGGPVSRPWCRRRVL